MVASDFIESRRFQSGLVLPAIIFISVLSLYILSMPRHITLEDAGELAGAAYFLSFAHPPGYPLYVLLGHMFTYLPLPIPAFMKVQLLSVFSGAASSVFIYFIGKQNKLGFFYSACLALLFAWSRTFWSQSIIIEVYSLQICLFFAAFYSQVMYKKRQQKKYLKLFAILLILGFANHWPLTVLTLPSLFLYHPKSFKDIFHHKILILTTVSFVILLYLLFIYRSFSEVPINFYGAIDTLEKFIFFISRKGYQGVDHNSLGGFADRFQFFIYYLKLLLGKEHFIGLGLLSFTGWFFSFKENKKLFFFSLANLIFCGLFLSLYLNFEFNFLMKNVFRVYPLVSFFSISTMAVFGCMYLEKKWQPKYIRAALVVMLMIHTYQNLNFNYRAKEKFAETLTNHLLDTIPAHTIYMAKGDSTNGLMAYARYVEQRRPDLELYNNEGLLFKNKMCSPFSTDKERSKERQYFFLKTKKSITSEHELPLKRKNIIYNGMFYQYGTKNNTSSEGLSKLTLSLNQKVHRFIEKINELHIKDPWSRYQREIFNWNYSEFLTKIFDYNPAERTGKFKEVYDYFEILLKKNFFVSLARLRILVSQKKMQVINEEMAWIEGIEKMKNLSESKRYWAEYLYLRGHVYHLQKKPAKAREYWQKSYDHQPVANSPALPLLKLPIVKK